jgi:hypothetical protein
VLHPKALFDGFFQKSTFGRCHVSNVIGIAPNRN